MSAELALTSAQLFAALTTRASSISQAQMPLSPAECVRIMGGGVGERLKPAVLKTVRLERVSGVRIPPPPPALLSNEPELGAPAAPHSFIIRPSRSDCGHASLPCAPTLEISLKCLLPAESPGWLGLGF